MNARDATLVHGEHGPQQTRLRTAYVCTAMLTLLIYAAAINPFFMPSTYDNAVYYLAARSIAAGDGYRFAGSAVVDWPPGFSLLAAALFSVGLKSVVAAKLMVLVSALIGLFLVRRYLHVEGRRYVWPTVLIFAALPTSMLMGTRIGSEWPYIAASFGCLLLMLRQSETRSLRTALATGVVLGMASLIRYAGVFLGAALIAQGVAQALRRGRSCRLRHVLPELVASATGAVIFAVWLVISLGSLAQGETPATAGNLDARIYLGFHPIAVVAAVGNLLFHSSDIVHHLGLARWAATLAVLMPGAVCVLGLVARRRRVAASDWYVIGYVAFLSFYEKGDVKDLTRYLLPVAPFLIGYLFEGLARVGLLLRLDMGVWRGRAASTALAMWLAAAVLCNVSVLLRGNPSRTYSGLCALVSRSPESFYRGYWRDLYMACRTVAESPDTRPVALAGTDDWQYVLLFCGRKSVPLEQADKAGFVIARTRHDRARSIHERAGLVQVGRWNEISLYERKSG